MQAKGALKDAGPEPEAFTFFKQQLWTGIDRLYVTIRDTAKQQLTNILNASHNPVCPRWPAPTREFHAEHRAQAKSTQLCHLLY